MATKTEDATPEATTAEETTLTKTADAPGTDAGLDQDTDADADLDAGLDADSDSEPDSDSEKGDGAGQGAAAVVSAALGVVALSGSWVATVAAARQTLIGQLRTAQSASVAKQVSAVYGDAWHTTALVGGAFALLALIIGAVVLARPAFGTPGRPQAVWIKSVAWAGVSLGVIGLVLAVAKYTDLLMSLPTPSA